MKYLNRKRGFTLLEVLIGVLVLSLALLGLAAVFPVVVRTQRIARDTVVGTGMLEAAESAVRSHQVFTRRLNVSDTSNGLAAYSRNLAQAPEAIQTKWEASLDSSNGTRRLYLDNGRLRLSTNNFGTMGTLERLNIQTGSANDATLIWDMAACLAGEQTTVTPPIGGPLSGVSLLPVRPVRIALFVRRIDARIRIPNGSTFANELVSDRIVPIGTSALVDGELSGDGRGGYYSAPMYANVTAALQSKRNGPYDVLEFNTPNNGRSAVSQAIGLPGQFLVDNLGGVHRVLRNTRNTDGSTVYNRVLLEQPVLGTTAARMNSGQNLVQVAFTAQVPTGVRVFTIQP